MRKTIASLAIVALLAAGCQEPGAATGQDLGAPEDGAAWYVYGQFTGYQTRMDPEKLDDGANPNGQNTTPNHGDRVSIRGEGYALFPESASFSASATPSLSLHTFRLRDGSNILLRSTTSSLEWYDTRSDAWETLKSGYQSGDFGYADNNVNTDQSSYVYFGNSIDPFSRWTGRKSYLTAPSTNGGVTIQVASTEGFPATGQVSYCGTIDTYSAKTATTFTVASSTACASGRGLAQAPEEFTNQALYPRGNIYLFADNRLWVSGTTSTPNQVYFSGYGTSTKFDFQSLVSSSTLADPGLFNLAEGGGPVTALVMDENSIYGFKRSIVYRMTLTDAVYSVTPLKAFDGKSQTSGAISKRAVFTTTNGVFFITPDNQIMMLDRVEYIDYPQATPISEPIKPTAAGLVFASSTGAVFRDKAYIAAKSVADAPANDVVLVYNVNDKTWDSPIVGWNPSDFAVYQDSDKEELYFSDGTSPNTYKVTDTPTDYIYNVKASWRSKQYTFGMPQGQKYMSNVYVEGYISPNTSISISLLLDEDGYTRRYSTTLSGSDATYVYDSSLYNVFGLKPFGTTRFGAQDDLSGKKKFRVYLGKDFQQVPFYNAQLEFASDGVNQQWEVVNYGMLVRPAPVPEKASLFKSFK